MRVYFAHPVQDYNTEKEQAQVAMLEQLGFEVVNPNNEETDIKYSTTKDFNIFMDMVRSCGAVAFTALPDGMIGAGVYKEILEAQKLGLPVIELPGALLNRTLTVEETRARIKQYREENATSSYT